MFTARAESPCYKMKPVRRIRKKLDLSGPKVFSMQVTIEQALQLAIQHHHAGRLAEAEKIYRQILARQPNHPDALNLLGVLASQVGRHDDAIELIRRSLILRPDYVSALVNLGNILCIQGKFDEAAFTCRRAIDLNPSDAVALNNLGIALLGQGKADESAIAYRRAIQLQPGYPEAFNNLGNALKHQGQLDEAIVAYRQAIELKPNYVDAWINLGNAHKDLGQFEEAANAYRQAIQHDPRFAEAYSNLAIALSGQGKIGDAIAACRQAIEVKPARAESHWNLGVLLLLSGDFEAGWKEYESRLLCMQFNTPANRFSQPAWHGQSLQGYTILLHAELRRCYSIFALRFDARPFGREDHPGVSVGTLCVVQGLPRHCAGYHARPGPSRVRFPQSFAESPAGLWNHAPVHSQIDPIPDCRSASGRSLAGSAARNLRRVAENRTRLGGHRNSYKR
jgi:tetratricopeptide (TPR) repeat protein